MVLVDVYNSKNITGKQCEELLDQCGITVNKNTIPFDTLKPMVSSGIRLGTPAMTTRGFKEKEFKQLATWINQAITHVDNPEEIAKIKQEVFALTKQFPILKKGE